jgi:hypothetical protein
MGKFQEEKWSRGVYDTGFSASTNQLVPLDNSINDNNNTMSSFNIGLLLPILYVYQVFSHKTWCLYLPHGVGGQ